MDSITPSNRSSSGLYHSISSLTRKALLALVTLLPFEAAATKAHAENKPEKEKIVRSYADESWAILKKGISEKNNQAQAYRWNNIIAALIVGDNTNVSGLDTTRNELLSLGKENPEIPIEVLETAIYSTGVNAEVINKEITENNTRIKALEDDSSQTLTIEKIKQQNENLIKRKQQTLKLVIEYLNSYPTDTTEQGTKTRKLIPAYELNKSKKEKVKNFQSIVNYAIAQLCSNEDTEHLTESFLDIKEKELAINFLNIFNYLSSNGTVTLPEKLLNKIKDDLSKSYLNKKNTRPQRLSSSNRSNKSILSQINFAFVSS